MYEEKLRKIQKLLEQKKGIDAQLKALLQPEKTVTSLPRGFSMSEEVLRIVRDAGTQGVHSQEILHKLQSQYHDSIDREKVASALAYLKNAKKAIGQASRGVYRIIGSGQG